MRGLDGEALATLRQGLYRFFGLAFRTPDPDRLRWLRDVAMGLDEDLLTRFAFHGPWVSLRTTLEAGVDPKVLQKEHVRLFSAGPRGLLCPPYESAYVNTPAQPTGFMVALQREYESLGLSLSPEYHGLPDHVSAETEAMALLCGVEAEAWRGGRAEMARRALEDQEGFLHRHLGKWLPRFDEAVREHTEVPFYAVLADAADAFVIHDLDLVQLIAGEVAM